MRILFPLFLISTVTQGCDPLSLLREASGKSSSAPASGAPSTTPPTSAAQPLEGPRPVPTSAGAVSVGSKVTMGKDTATVLELYGKLAKLRYGGGDDWDYLSKTTPAGTPLPDPHGDSCSVLVGQRVKATWPWDKKKYLARVGEVYGKLARVAHQDDGALQWLACDDCDPVF
jgi:hypothetical protein